MKTVLVVDDMAIFREPIAAALRQKGYATQCADNGRTALQLLDSVSPDLILLDVAMPEMDGLTFLKTIRTGARFRDLPVILLTAVAERDYVVRASQLGIADYLLKSQFSLSEMLARVDRHINKPAATPAAPPATSPDHAEPAPRITNAREHVLRAFHVGAVSPVLAQVLSLIDNPASTIDDIAGMVRLDQALSVRVMRAANSAFYATGRRTQDLAEATQRLGLNGVRNIVITIATIDHFADRSPGGLVPQRFWEHSLSTAIFSQALARHIPSLAAEQLYLAGLLHDLGRYALASLYPEPYRHILTHAPAAERGIEAAERAAFGIGHAELTHDILTQWRLPKLVVDAASLHERPVDRIRSASHDSRGSLVVGLANRLSHALAYGDSGNPCILELDAFARALDLTRTTLETVARERVTNLKDVHVFFASTGGESLLPPMAAELAGLLGTSVRIGTACSSDYCNPLALFLEQVGCVEASDPQLAVVNLADASTFRKQLDRVTGWDVARGFRIPVLTVAGSFQAAIPTILTDGRNHTALTLPAPYTTVIEALKSLIDSNSDRITPAAGQAATPFVSR